MWVWRSPVCIYFPPPQVLAIVITHHRAHQRRGQLGFHAFRGHGLCGSAGGRNSYFNFVPE